jgi:hypothetical protein
MGASRGDPQAESRVDISRTAAMERYGFMIRFLSFSG